MGKIKPQGNAPVRIEIKPVGDLPPIDVSEDHPEVPRIIKLFMAGLFPYLFGDAGNGKTTALMRAATILGEIQGRTIGMEIDTCDRSTPRSAILGYRTPNGDPVQTPFTSLYANGGLLIHDEMDNAPAYVQSILNTALANGHSPSAWGTIKRHPDFFYCAAGNTPFRPTARFPDRLPGSFAYMDRLYFVHFEIDPNIERRACGRPLVKRPARKAETCSAANWGAWVEEVRAWTKENTPTIQVTPRATFSGLKALAAGETPLEAAHGLVFRGADSALVDKILSAVPLPRS
jgi:MoxR-like ATPase